jgi:outer membrane protein OmpA-like peptidoglycan-associated protein
MKKFSMLIILLILVAVYAFSNVDKAQEFFKNEITSGSLQVKVVDKKIVFTVPFNFSEMQPYGKTRNSLIKISKYIKLLPSYNILIEGHTDNIKPKLAETLRRFPDLAAYSLGRAEAVKLVLISLGIKNDKIKTTGAADTKPASDNNTDEGRAKNRRVEITVDFTAAVIPAQIPQVQPQQRPTTAVQPQQNQGGTQARPQIEITQPGANDNRNLPPANSGDRGQQ